MDGLRWLLLLFGAIVIVGVYFYSRRAKSNAADPAKQSDADAPGQLASSDRIEPKLEAPSDIDAFPDDPDMHVDVPELQASDEDNTPALGPTPIAQKIVTLRIVARATKAFKGDELVLSMRGIGLRHGKFGIFHRYDGIDESQTIFSAASLVEPGSFDLENIKEQEIPGISLFLVLPGPVDPVESFDLMMAAARTMSQSLEGELLDESGSTLSIQRERYLREEIIQFQHSHMVA